jgi:hypothetical protein
MLCMRWVIVDEGETFLRHALDLGSRRPVILPVPPSQEGYSSEGRNADPPASAASTGTTRGDSDLASPDATLSPRWPSCCSKQASSIPASRASRRT